MTNSTVFRPGQSACVAHEAIKTALKTMEKAKQCAVLWFGEIMERKLYLELGYSSINQYARLELGFSETRTGDYLHLCRKLEKLPKVKAKVASGELGYTPARVLVSIADHKNEEELLDFALNNSRRKLEKEVKRAKKAAAEMASGQQSLLPENRKLPAAVVPVRVRLEMSPGQFARYESLWEQVRKKGKAPADKVEALLEMMACYVAETSPREEVELPQGEDNLAPTDGDFTNCPPFQIHIHQCPDCKESTVQTSKGELELSEAELDRAQCDCQISKPGQRNRSAIPPKTRREVLARDRHRCRRPGCGHTKYLEIHHKVPRSRGGTNHISNLVTLCAGCHQLLHEHKTAAFGFNVKSVGASYLGQYFEDEFWDLPGQKVARYNTNGGREIRGSVFRYPFKGALRQGRSVEQTDRVNQQIRSAD